VILVYGCGADPAGDWPVALKGLMSLVICRQVILIDGVNRITFSLMRGLRPIVSYGQILMAIYWIFAVAGTHLFSSISTQYFGSIMESIFTLFQLLLGEGWHDVMYAVCDQTISMASWYFVSYVFLISILFAQLFVGFIIERFSEIQSHVKKEGMFQEDPCGLEALQSKVQVLLQARSLLPRPRLQLLLPKALQNLHLQRWPQRLRRQRRRIGRLLRLPKPQLQLRQRLPQAEAMLLRCPIRAPARPAGQQRRTSRQLARRGQLVAPGRVRVML